MKINLLVIFFLITIAGQNCFARPTTNITIRTNSNLLFGYNLYDDNNKAYLMPFIETSLKALKKGGQDNRLFDTVGNLNILMNKSTISSKIKKVFRYFDRMKMELPANNFNDQVIDDEIAKLLSTYDYFLHISIIPLGKTLEYQLTLFELSKGRNYSTVRDIDPTRYRITSFFIDPEKADYKEYLFYELKQFFFEANDAPEPVIRKEGHNVAEINCVELNKPTVFTAGQIDNDSYPENMKYRWKVIDPDYKECFLENVTSRVQELVFEKPGIYQITLSVSDGISMNQKTFIFGTGIRPKLNISFTNSEALQHVRENISFNYSFFDKSNASEINSEFISLPQIVVESDVSNLEIYKVSGAKLNEFKKVEDVSAANVYNQPDQSNEPFYLEKESYDFLLQESKLPVYYTLKCRNLSSPSRYSFAIVATGENGLRDTSYIHYRHARILRWMVNLEWYSYLSGKKDESQVRSSTFYIGATTILSRTFSMSYAIGITSPVSNAFQIPTRLKETAYKAYLMYCSKGVNQFKRNPDYSIVLAFANRPVYDRVKGVADNRFTSLGFGVKNTNQPKSIGSDNFLLGSDFTFIYYPKALNSFRKGLFEFGIRANLYFIRDGN